MDNLKTRFSCLALILLISFTFALFGGEGYAPTAVYLTWEQHPESTMVIHWITPTNHPEDTVLYRESGEKDWQMADASHTTLPEGHTEYLIHTLQLTNLKSDTDYQFRPGKDATEFSFHTMPSNQDQPIRFVVGGDMYHDSLALLEQANCAAASFDPMFALLGGDLAYASPKDVNEPEDMQRWIEFVQAWQKCMVTSKGNLIPIIASTSNEDTKGRYDQPASNAAFFYALFMRPSMQGYKVVDFGKYLSVWVLDSDHTNPIHGKQDLWLEKTLVERQQIPHKFALYHVPAYPSVRPYVNKTSPLIRKYWVPLFEKYGINVAFEHHDHAYKRTYPIFQNRVDPKGVVYIGDGGWAVERQRVPETSRTRWYIATSASKTNFSVVTVYPNHVTTFSAIEPNGESFDQSTIQP